MAKDPAANKTFDGGCQAPVRQFREHADATLQPQEEPQLPVCEVGLSELTSSAPIHLS